MGNTKETMSFIKWIDVLGVVQLLLEENAQPVSYTQMDSLTCGIYPLIPLSDTGFPSHTHLQTAISYYRCCPSPPCSLLPLTRKSDVGTSEQSGQLREPGTAQRTFLVDRAVSNQQCQPACYELGQRHAALQSPLLQPPFPWCSCSAQHRNRQ